MSLWTVAAPAQASTSAVTGTSLPYATITASATPHTMGSWTTLVASTPWAVDAITLGIFSQTFTAGTDTSMLMDIGVGAAASEVVVIGGIPVGWSPVGPRAMVLPVRVASGVRIAARIQSAVVSATCPAGLILTGGGGWLRPAGGGVVDSYGVTSASSSGTAIADVGTAHTKGAYTEITSGTTRRHRFLIPLPALGAGNNNVVSGSVLYDVAIGASGSEVVIIPNLGQTDAATEELRQPTLQPFPVNLPVGTRLSARQQKSTTTTSPLSLVLLGID